MYSSVWGLRTACCNNIWPLQIHQGRLRSNNIASASKINKQTPGFYQAVHRYIITANHQNIGIPVSAPSMEIGEKKS